MIRAYSQRLLPPYSAVVQIAESAKARAQSFDGVHWDVHYLAGNDPAFNQLDRPKGYALDRSYYQVAHIEAGDLKTYNFPAFLNASDVSTSIAELHEYLGNVDVPFPAMDRYEYWLLDGRDESPLALILSCCDESLITTLPAQAAWTALPHSKLKIANTSLEKERHEAPVNHRFQDLINRRAGARPKAVWVERKQGDSEDFPSLLVREDWADGVDQDLCGRYLHRKAPRLLMLQGLAYEDRERMEIAARKYALEVDEYFALYPTVNDEGRMAAIRVEAQFIRTAPELARKDDREDTSAVTPLSKDMRIIEN